MLLPVELEEEAQRAMALPSESRLQKLSALLIETLQVSTGTTIEIQVWSRRYHPQNLSPDSRLLRHFRFDLASAQH